MSGEELGMEEGDTVVGMYCMREKPIFKKEKKRTKKIRKKKRKSLLVKGKIMQQGSNYCSYRVLT